MSDSEHSSVTYTSVPSPVEDYLDIGSPEVNGPLSPDYMLGPEEPEQAPLSPDYVPGLEEPEQAPLSPDYVPSPEEPEQAPLSPDYVPGPEEPEQAPPSHVYLPYVPKPVYPEDPEEDEEDPADYPANSTVVALLAVDHVPSEERLRFASPTPSQEVGESSAAGAARQNEPAISRDDPYSLVREELYGFIDRVDVAPEHPMSKELGYGITDTWDELAGASEEIAPTTLQGVNQRVTDLSTIIEQETTIMYENGTKTNYKVNSSRNNPALETTTSVTNAQLQAMIDQGVTDALEARDATRNGDDSHTSGTGRPVQVAHECTYLNFLKCQPLNFKGTEGVVKGTDVVAYSQRFQELALMCNRTFPKEKDKVERYVDGLPDTINGGVMATKPKTMQDAIEFATELMNKKINTWAERQADNKRKSDDTTLNNHQQPNKRQNTRRAYAAGNVDKRAHEGPRPRYTKCNYHHDGPYAPKCYKCNRFGHLSRDCRNPLIVNTGANQRGNVYFECGA
nr:hypothetical protein [Tanacetum cinerariifolium]